MKQHSLILLLSFCVCLQAFRMPVDVLQPKFSRLLRSRVQDPNGLSNADPAYNNGEKEYLRKLVLYLNGIGKK